VQYSGTEKGWPTDNMVVAGIANTEDMDVADIRRWPQQACCQSVNYQLLNENGTNGKDSSDAKVIGIK